MALVAIKLQLCILHIDDANELAIALRLPETVGSEIHSYFQFIFIHRYLLMYLFIFPSSIIYGQFFLVHRDD